MGDDPHRPPAHHPTHTPQPTNLTTATLAAVLTATTAITGHTARWKRDGVIPPAVAELLLAVAGAQHPPRRCTRPPRLARSTR